MATLSVVNASGRSVGQHQLDERVFDGSVHIEAIRQTVLNYLANQRVGTASTKMRGEVSGGGKKPWRQKGTGRARAGTNRSPLWRHGGVTFGPKPRNYRYEIPKKVKRLALKATLNAKLQDEAIVVLESLQLEEAKTKQLVLLLQSVGAPHGALIVAEASDERLQRASRNIPDLLVRTAGSVHPYEIIRCKKLVVTLASLSLLSERLAGQADPVEESPVHA